LPIIAWYGLKPVFSKAKDSDLYQKAYKRLQYNPEIFNSLLTQQSKAANGWEQLGILVGNPNATNTIIKVCNPYCGPCARMHPIVEDIIKYNSNINLRIIFASRNNEHDENAIVAKHLLAIAAELNPDKIHKALDDWYLAKKDLR